MELRSLPRLQPEGNQMKFRIISTIIIGIIMAMAFLAYLATKDTTTNYEEVQQ